MTRRALGMVIGLLEPVRAICDSRLYASASSRSSWQAIEYIGYIAIISAVLGGIWIRLSIIPNVDEMIAWVAPRMPTLELTANGTKTNVIQPYLVSAGPRGGTFLCVDTESGSDDACREARFVVRKDRIVVGAVDTGVGPWTYDLEAITDGERRVFHYMLGDGPGLHALYLRFRSWSVAAVALLVGVVVFIWKVGVALAVATVALLTGRLFGARLRWPGVLNVAAWAVTPATVLQGLSVFGLAPVSMFRMSVSAVVTSTWVVAGTFVANGGVGRRAEDDGAHMQPPLS